MDAQKTGAYLAMLRKIKGMTQQEVADRLGVSNKTVSKWESGGGFPDITVLPALAELYGVTADDILAGETLTDRRRDMVQENTAVQKKRLLMRLKLMRTVPKPPAPVRRKPKTSLSRRRHRLGGLSATLTSVGISFTPGQIMSE